MTKNSKIGVQILYFDAEQFILNTIDNCAPFVDRIYVLYSKLPWLYNTKARDEYSNSSSLQVLSKSPYSDKIEIIEGTYNTEEEQRNHGLQKAKEDGIDYLIIQDPDEFYLPEDYKSNIREMIKHAEYLYFRTPWILFWKRINYVIEFKWVHGEKKTIINYNPAFAINCRKDVFFKRNRLLSTTESYFLKKPCFHLSYYVSDDQLIRKINTWGHAAQFFNKRKWIRYKWLGWKPGTRNINPINPVAWIRAVEHEFELPDEILKIPKPENVFKKLSPYERIGEIFYDLHAGLYYYLNNLKSYLINTFGKL
jgi:hypothetical protein